MATFKRDQKARVFEGTVEFIKDGGYLDKDENLHKFNLSDLKKNSKFFQKVKQTTGYSGKYNTKIYTQLIDCLQKAYEFGDSGALLNMASRFTAGGGVIKGSSAQEEEICRRTTLSYSLFQFDKDQKEVYSDSYGSDLPTEVYPMKGDRCGIWSPGVEIFRSNAKGYYDTFVQPGITNVITVPGVQKPELTEDGSEFKETHAKMWRNKMRTVLRMALHGGKTKLVLGAWGCGAYGNPPKLVAKLFNEILNEPEFLGAFEEICFSIIEDHNSAKGGNYAPFAEVFGHK